jgi:hypothetical protein
MAEPPRPPLRVQNQYNGNIDPRLLAIIEQAAQYTPYVVELRSGFRPGDSRQHGKGNAIDINLIDPKSGEALPNYQNGANFREYEQFAQNARAIQMSNYPELEQDFRWGGYFGSKKGAFGYGALDLMHFDLAGQQIGMGQGSWKNGLSEKMANAYGINTSKGMGENYNSRTYLASLTPGGAAPQPPNPAALPPSLATKRNAPSATQLAAIRAVPPGAPSGTALEAITGPAKPPTTATAYAPPTGSPTNWGEFYGKFGRYGPPTAPPTVPPNRPTYQPQVMQTAEQIYKGFPFSPTQAAALVPATYTPPPMGTTFSPKGPQALAIPTNRRNTVAALSPPPASTLQPLATPGLTKAVEIPQARLIDHRGLGKGIAQQRAEQAMLRGRAPIAAPIVPPVGPAPIAPMPMTRPVQRPPVPMMRPQVRAPVPMMRPVPRQPVNITVRGGNVMVPTPAPRLNRPAYVQPVPVPVQQSETLRGRRGLSEGTRNNISNSGSATGTALWQWITGN